MLIGLIKWFDYAKQFGVLVTPNKREFFLHINSFKNKPTELLVGTPVIFTVRTTRPNVKVSALSSRLVGNQDDWKQVFSHLGQLDSMTIEVEETAFGKRGNPYSRRANKSFSLICQALKYILVDKTEEEIIESIEGYFDNDLDKTQFVLFCEEIEKGVITYLPEMKANRILEGVFTYFGKFITQEILFAVWKSKKFKYLGRIDESEYEIPEEILLKNI